MIDSRFGSPKFKDKLAKARNYQRNDPALFKRSKFLFFFLGILLLAIAYYLALSPRFLVKSVKFAPQGLNSELVADALKKMSGKRVYLIPSSHILLLTRQRFQKELQTEFPEIRKITSFKRLPPDRIEASLELREASYIWQSGEDYYLLDQDGVVFQKLLNYEPLAYSETLIVDRTLQPVTVGETLDVQMILEFINLAQELAPQEVPEVGLLSFSVPSVKSLDIFAKTSVGFEVYFDLERSVKAQLKNLALLLRQEIKPETWSGLSYIDLRLPNLAYYCYKDAPCAPESQSITNNNNQ